MKKAEESLNSEVISFFKEKIILVESRLRGIEEKQSEFTEKFIIMDAKKSMIEYLIVNWWKIAAVIIPSLFFLGEIGYHIRKLV